MTNALRNVDEQFAVIGEWARPVVELPLTLALLALLLSPILWPVYAVTLGLGWTLFMLWFGLWAWVIIPEFVDDSEQGESE